MKRISAFLLILLACTPGYAALNVWSGRARITIQQWQGSITTTTAGHTYELEFTDIDDATAGTFSYALTSADTTTTLAAASFATAFNRSNLANVNECTATSNAAIITISGKGDGKPFDITDTSSGTGTWSGTGVTLPSSCPYNYNQSDNWSLAAVPVGTNDVLIPPGTTAILYGLNQSAVAIGKFHKAENTAQIGRYETGALRYLRIDPDELVVKGSDSLTALDIGSAAIAVVIDHDASAGYVTGLPAVNLKGSAITTVSGSGYIGIGAHPGASTTVSAGFRPVGGTWVVGNEIDGPTVSGTTLINKGASVTAYVAIPTVEQFNTTSEYRQQKNPSGSATYTIHDGVFRPNGTGTYGTVVLENDAVVRTDEDHRAKTWTTTTIRGSARPDETGLIIYTNQPNKAGGTSSQYGGNGNAN